MEVKNLFRKVKYPIEIFDSKGNKIYYKDSDGDWYIKEYDNAGRVTFYTDSSSDSKKYWWKKEYDSAGNVIYYERSDKYWLKKEYDSTGNVIYYENSYGIIRDKRPKNKTIELSIDDIAKKFDVSVNELKKILG